MDKVRTEQTWGWEFSAKKIFSAFLLAACLSSCLSALICPLFFCPVSSRALRWKRGGLLPRPGSASSLGTPRAPHLLLVIHLSVDRLIDASPETSPACLSPLHPSKGNCRPSATGSDFKSYPASSRDCPGHPPGRVSARLSISPTVFFPATLLFRRQTSPTPGARLLRPRAGFALRFLSQPCSAPQPPHSVRRSLSLRLFRTGVHPSRSASELGMPSPSFCPEPVGRAASSLGMIRRFSPLLRCR